MLISPVLLDFMEQALEPIPLPDNKPCKSTIMPIGDSSTNRELWSSIRVSDEGMPQLTVELVGMMRRHNEKK